MFEFFYNKAPFFKVFRTADIRFGFLIVFCLGILLINSSKKIHKYILSSLLALIMAVQVYPLFSGIGVRGENVKDLYFDRVVFVPKDYKEVSDLLDSDTRGNYVLTIPGMPYGHFLLDGHENYVGQDLLSKITKNPLVYAYPSTGIHTNTLENIQNMISERSFSQIRRFPFKYLVLRNDVVKKDPGKNMSFHLDSSYKLLLENDTFMVYEVLNNTPLISGRGVSYEYINPIKFKVSIKRLNETQTLVFLQSFNKHWKLYPDTKWGIGGKPVFDEGPNLHDGYANFWEISSSELKKKLDKTSYTVNSDGSIDVDFVLYYQPQRWFILSLIASLSFFVGLLVVFYYMVRKKNANH